MAAAGNGIRLLGVVAIRTQVEALTDRFAAGSGCAVEMAYDLNPAVARRIVEGESFDLGMTNPHYLPELIAAGRVEAGTQRPFGRIPLAVAARRGGTPATTGDEISALLMAADAVAYTGDGTSGRQFLETAGRLGLREAIRGRARPMGPGQPVRAAAAGEVALAIAPLTTVIAAPGVEAVAIFPSELGADIEMAMFLAATPRDRKAAMQLLDFLTDPAIDALLAAGGVVRSRP